MPLPLSCSARMRVYVSWHSLAMPYMLSEKPSSACLCARTQAGEQMLRWPSRVDFRGARKKLCALLCLTRPTCSQAHECQPSLHTYVDSAGASNAYAITNARTHVHTHTRAPIHARQMRVHTHTRALIHARQTRVHTHSHSTHLPSLTAESHCSARAVMSSGDAAACTPDMTASAHGLTTAPSKCVRVNQDPHYNAVTPRRTHNDSQASRYCNLA